MPESTRERLSAAAYALFDERGYDATTVDMIAERAGVGRTTFFRAFRGKDDVVMPDHDRVLGRVRGRLDTVPDQARPAAVSAAAAEAAHLVLAHYLAEGDLARARYRLTRTVPALRQREVAGLQTYQRTFREFFAGRVGSVGEGESGEVRAEVLAAAVVTAHNHVLRRWLRGGTDDPVAALDRALDDVLRLFAPPLDRTDGSDGPGGSDGSDDSDDSGRPGRTDHPGAGTRVVVLQADGDLDEVLPAVRAALDGLSPVRPAPRR